MSAFRQLLRHPSSPGQMYFLVVNIFCKAILLDSRTQNSCTEILPTLGVLPYLDMGEV